MPWRNAYTVSFTRIDIVSKVPPESGVYAILDSRFCLLVGDSWNVRARLLELANVLGGVEGLSVTYELCDESCRDTRRLELIGELMNGTEAPPSDRYPGLLLLDPDRQSA